MRLTGLIVTILLFLILLNTVEVKSWQFAVLFIANGIFTPLIVSRVFKMLNL